MLMLIDKTKLKLLLCENKEKIGHANLDGIDTIFSAASFFLSSVLATYTGIGIITGKAIKISCIILSVAFFLWGCYLLTRSIRTRYGSDALMYDIENLDQTEHAFSLVAIKDGFSGYPNRFLLRYDTRWQCWLFPYYASQDESGEDVIRITESLSNQFRVPEINIQLMKRGFRIQTKFSVSDNIEKTYAHTLYQADMPFPQAEQSDSFQIYGTQFRWMSIDEMLADSDIAKKNSDVIYFVRDCIS